MSRFGIKRVTIELEGETFELRALKVKEFERLVEKYGESDPMGLTAALISASSLDGKLSDVTREELDEWPAAPFRALQAAILELNGMVISGAPGPGNG